MYRKARKLKTFSAAKRSRLKHGSPLRLDLPAYGVAGVRFVLAGPEKHNQ